MKEYPKCQVIYQSSVNIGDPGGTHPSQHVDGEEVLLVANLGQLRLTRSMRHLQIRSHIGNVVPRRRRSSLGVDICTHIGAHICCGSRTSRRAAVDGMDRRRVRVPLPLSLLGHFPVLLLGYQLVLDALVVASERIFRHTFDWMLRWLNDA